MSWDRVNKKHPCEVCGKPDYCTYSFDASCCMRQESDVPMANGGWRHLKGNPDYSKPPRAYHSPTPLSPPLDAWAFWEKWMKVTKDEDLQELAKILHLTTDSLEQLGTIRLPNGWGFPMHDEKGEIIGIRTRDRDGTKKAITGSKAGIFMPLSGWSETVYITEGPSDCAAGLDLGMFTIGRPSCLGQEELVANYLRHVHARHAIIIADNDEAGLRGAKRLRAALQTLSLTIALPVKDLREFASKGGSRLLIENMTKDLVWS